MPAAPTLPQPAVVASATTDLRARITANLARAAETIAASRQAHDALLRRIVAQTKSLVLPPADRALLSSPSSSGNDETSLDEILASLRQLLSEIQSLEAGHARLSGLGTAASPYRIASGPLYVRAPITLVFPGVKPEQLKSQPAGRRLVLGP